jgi:8-oxo-dGTP pyrophosphatase MutT (NUDIX family)
MTDTSPPVEPRPAATLIVLRQDGPITRILMGRRSAQHRYMPNVLVFPGGKVDLADYTAAIASPLSEAVTKTLHRHTAPDLAQALAVTAARELCEEVGLSLGTPPALDGLDYLCRAITPPGRPIRFDARFFMVDAARVTGEATASAEIEAPCWLTLDEARQGELALVTTEVLKVLERFLENPAGFARNKVFQNRQWDELF